MFELDVWRRANHLIREIQDCQCLVRIVSTNVVPIYAAFRFRWWKHREIRTQYSKAHTKPDAHYTRLLTVPAVPVFLASSVENAADQPCTKVDGLNACQTKGTTNQRSQWGSQRI